MLNKTITIFLLLMCAGSMQRTFSQNTCCAGAGANYTILPNLNRNVIGMRYSFGNYLSENHVSHTEQHGLHTHTSTETIPVKEQLHSLEIFGRFHLASRLQLSVFIPVHLIHQQTPIVQKRAGLGDMSFLLQYSFLKPVFCGNTKPKHQLRAGIGAKLPSGAFGERDAMQFNLQPGTGSIDFLASVIYTFRYRQFGFNTSAAYKLNTTNPQGYYFGDKAQGSIQLFYVFEVKGVQLMPSAGFTYEHRQANRYQRELVGGSEAHFLGGSAGFDVYYKHFAFSTALIPAFMNNMNGTGQTPGKLGAEAGVYYNFSVAGGK
jgi:hypothetical protein